jgi:hypothetical protein
MAASRFSSFTRVLFSFIAATLLLTLYFASSSKPYSDTDKMSTRGSDPISGLKVSLEQTTSADSPLTITATVTNTNDKPVTILDYDSPLDKAALALGLLQITPEGATEPIELPIIQFRRVWPPSKDSLTTIPAGGSAKNEIALKEPVVSMEDLGSKPSVKLAGQWRAVWQMEKGEISDDLLDDPTGSGGASTGDYASEPLELHVQK